MDLLVYFITPKWQKRHQYNKGKISKIRPKSRSKNGKIDGFTSVFLTQKWQTNPQNFFHFSGGGISDF